MFSRTNILNPLLGIISALSAYKVLSTPLLPDEQRLLNKLFNDQMYDNSVRPVFNSSRNVEVTFGFTLIQIMDMDEKNQLVVTNAWLEMKWKDERIWWNESNYNHLSVIRLPAKRLWLPDVVLYNNADDYTTGFMPINAMVHSDGIIIWSPPVRLKSSCKVDITYFPFDHQVCSLKFGSWMYDKAQVDMVITVSEVEVSRYVTNGEWMLVEYKVVRNEVVYPISAAIYPDVTVVLLIQRRVLYYVLNILFPCFWLNILSVLTFCLPPDAGEKITLSITVLLSYSVFMLLVAESMPPTSEFVPLIGIYLTVSMAVASVSVILTVLVLKLHHCSPKQKRIPRWVRHYVLGFLARLVRCSCTNTCMFLRNSRIDKTRQKSDNEVENREVHTRLLKEIESMSVHNTGSDHATFETSSTQTNIGYGRTQLLSELDRSRPNLDYKDGQTQLLSELDRSRPNLDYKDTSARSSVADDNYNVCSKRDRSVAAMEDILKYLKFMVVKSDGEDSENEIIDEWKQVALVVDRLFFWLFLLITIFSTIIILVVVPSFKYISKDGI